MEAFSHQLLAGEIPTKPPWTTLTVHLDQTDWALRKLRSNWGADSEPTHPLTRVHNLFCLVSVFGATTVSRRTLVIYKQRFVLLTWLREMMEINHKGSTIMSCSLNLWGASELHGVQEANLYPTWPGSEWVFDLTCGLKQHANWFNKKTTLSLDLRSRYWESSLSPWCWNWQKIENMC